MPGQAATVLVTERQGEILLSLRDPATTAAHIRQRALIVLLAFEGLRNHEIAGRARLGPRFVGRWRRRWAERWAELVEIERDGDDVRLRRAIETALDDRPRVGAPAKFTTEQIARILAVARKPPQGQGRSRARWRNRDLAEEVVRRGIVASISPSQVGRFVRRAEAPSPGREPLAALGQKSNGAAAAAPAQSREAPRAGTGRRAL